MKLNNKGFAISSILYMALILFLVLIASLLALMGGRKNILDKIRLGAYNRINHIVDTSSNTTELDIAQPTLLDNMIPVVYNPAGYAQKADVNNWYNYNQRKWANAVVVKSNGTNTREYYQTAASGITINQEDILGYFVWIPRYKYAIDETDDTVKIIFENKGIAKSTGTAINNSYLTHPAFTFDENELNGIWVSKFLTSVDDDDELNGEMGSGNSNIKVLPGKQALMDSDAVSMFWAARKMELTNNIYGFSQTSTNFPAGTGVIEEDSNTLDTHVLKNIEWGAVSLLALSQYGINGSIKKYDSNNNAYTGGGINLSYLVNVEQNTTGNKYGIYDMVNTNGEIVMGYKSDSGISYENDVYVNEIYYDKYASDATSGIKGDLTNGDSLTASSVATFPEVDNYFLRGQTSLLSYTSTSGEADSNNGFRISLAIWE